MISSARYPKIDGANAAVFSPSVISGRLRGTLGYGGVVISDDVGAAKAVAAIPTGERAVRFVDATRFSTDSNRRPPVTNVMAWYN